MWTSFLCTALVLLLAAETATAAARPYRVSLVGDEFDGTSWHTGVLIELEPGWKTYWRMPGDSGVPPEFTFTPSQPARAEVQYPTPVRHVDKSGEAVGYETRVLFPVTVTPEKPESLELALDLFFGVCKDVCIPAQAQASIKLGTEERDPLGSVHVDSARALVPTPRENVVSASLATEDGKPVLKLSLKERTGDIFVESTTSAYFRAPVLSEDGREARIAIDGLSEPDKLSGQPLKLTYTLGGKGYEQTVTLP